MSDEVSGLFVRTAPTARRHRVAATWTEAGVGKMTLTLCGQTTHGEVGDDPGTDVRCLVCETRWVSTGSISSLPPPPEVRVVRLLVYEGTAKWVQHTLRSSEVRGRLYAAGGNQIVESFLTDNFTR